MKPLHALARIGMAVTWGLALGAADAQPGGPGPGKGAGPGQGYGFGPNDTPGWSLMSEQERSECRNRMHSSRSYDEFRMYMNDFAHQMQQRAKEKGTTVRGPNEAACDRMWERGFFK